MKKLYLIIVVILSFNVTQAQNLLSNGSFELYDSCPNHFSQIEKAKGWFQPTIGTPDYLNTCVDSTAGVIDIPLNLFGYQMPRTGNAYAGLALFSTNPPLNIEDNYREYIETKLAIPMKSNTKYYISFYVSFADSGINTTSRVGAYLSNDSVIDLTIDSNLNFKPQIENPKGHFIKDNTNWEKVSGSYTAKGGEQFITIGNFYNNLETDTIFVWSHGINYWQDGYYYIDDVCISEDSLTCNPINGIQQLENLEFNIYPNPFKNAIEIVGFNTLIKELKLYDGIGNEVLGINYQKLGNDRIQLQFNESLQRGIYTLKLSMTNGEYKLKRMLKID